MALSAIPRQGARFASGNVLGGIADKAMRVFVSERPRRPRPPVPEIEEGLIAEFSVLPTPAAGVCAVVDQAAAASRGEIPKATGSKP